MKEKVFRWSLAVALSVFLFGFDTAVISGADQPIQRLWSMSSSFHSFFIISMVLWGAVFGAFLGDVPIDKYGRKKVLFWIGVLYPLSAIGSAMAWDPYSFSFFRFLGGLVVGASSVAAPTYISEVSPSSKRGRLVALYQSNIVLGILIAFLTNWLVGSIVGVGNWRLMLGLEAVPAFFYCIMILGVPKSPRWLILNQGEEDEARKTLSILNPELIDRIGRRALMIYGSIGYILTLVALAWGLMTGAEGMLIVALVFGFITSHAIGQGAVIWVFISKIFPNSVRASGQALGTVTHWVFAAIITLITLPVIEMLGNNPWGIFAFFAFMMVLQLAYTLFLMPAPKESLWRI